MPLITCPDCGTEMSLAAVACPKCGRPNTSKPTGFIGKGCVIQGLGVVLAPVAFFLLFYATRDMATSVVAGIIVLGGGLVIGRVV